MKTLLKKMLIAAALAAGTSVLPLAAGAAETPKKHTVAVAKVEVLPTLNAKIHREGRDEAMRRIVESLTDNMGSAINGTRRLEVVTVGDLDVIVKAIERGESILSSAALAPSLKNFDYGIAIKIDDYQDLEQQKEFPSLGQTLTYRNIRIGAIANFIESATGTIAESPNFIVSKSIKLNSSAGVRTVGDKSDEIVAQLTRELCKKIAFKLADKLAPPRVIAVGKDGKTVTINKGDDTDIYVGQIYEVFALGEEMIDPDTGESLGREEEYAGKVRVRRVNAKFSQADVLENVGIEKNGVARPAVSEPESRK